MSDQMERNLQELADQALAVWKHHGCLECAMGELAALAAATLTFYTTIGLTLGHKRLREDD